MIVVAVLYANEADLRFNMNYYLETHIPLVRRLLGPALKAVTVEQGSSGAAPGSKAAYAVIARLSFESVAAFQAAFGPHGAEIAGDVANFASVQPVVQISDVRLG